MKAIITKYIGPSNVRGSRYKATDGDNSITLGADNSLSAEGNHLRAAKALCRKLDWKGQYIGGGLSGRGGVMAGYVWVCSSSAEVFMSNGNHD